jgi:hypothetical protein
MLPNTFWLTCRDTPRGAARYHLGLRDLRALFVSCVSNIAERVGTGKMNPRAIATRLGMTS